MHDRMYKWHTYNALEDNCCKFKDNMVVTMEMALG